MYSKDYCIFLVAIIYNENMKSLLANNHWFLAARTRHLNHSLNTMISSWAYASDHLGNVQALEITNTA